MKSRISSLAVISLFFSHAFGGDESPSLVSRYDGETVSAANVTYNAHLSPSEKLTDSAVGIDDTLNTFSTDIDPLLTGRSFESGTAFAHSRVTANNSGGGIREIRITHNGRIALKAPENFVENDSVNVNFSSYNQVSFAPYRISGNQAPISLVITCEVADCIMQDPLASQSGIDVNLFAGHHLVNFSNGTSISSASGSIELETAFYDDPGFIFDLTANGSSTDLGNGRFRVNSSYSRSVTTGYLKRLDFVNRHGGTFVCNGFVGNDTEPWVINSGAGVNFTITSSDPNVRFFVFSKENPNPKPDLQIGRSLGRLKGKDIQQNTATGSQKMKINQGRKKMTRFYLRLENNGPDVSGGSGDSSITLRGPKRSKSTRLSYFQFTNTTLVNVTAAVRSGRYRLPAHFENFGEDLQVRSKKKKSRPVGKRKVSRVNFISSNPAGGGRDVVRAFLLTK